MGELVIKEGPLTHEQTDIGDGKTTFTVSELIEKLKEFDGDMQVCISGYEEGYDSLMSFGVFAKELYMNVETAWMYGDHSTTPNGKKDATRKTCLCLARWGNR